eukprot:4854215-Alexandrium_andersonii.AAC.1
MLPLLLLLPHLLLLFFCIRWGQSLAMRVTGRVNSKSAKAQATGSTGGEPVAQRIQAARAPSAHA